MTSGYFVFATDQQQQQQHHYLHHQQQYQENYKQQKDDFSTPLIPVVPRLHLIPQQHVIIRRDNFPHHQQLQPDKGSSHHHHPAIVPTASMMKKSDMLQIEEELKELKKKRKRLRQLREEVRELSDHLKSKRTFSKDGTEENDLFSKHKTKETHIRWRKQITTRVKAIMKRLKRLENEVKIERNLGKEMKRMAKRLPILPLKIHTSPLPTTLLITTNKDFKIKRLHSSINQSKNGESGGICLGHNDCKPGLCCHRTSSSNANSSSSTTSNVCHQYMLKEGDLCEDSCQCEAQLHCFRSSSQFKTEQSIMKSKRSLYAICKKVSMGDIVNGVYLNSKDSSFPIKAI
uniref:Uncharacterized protein n=1 Tax=Setaria digitata TaxID=48799 RepID=A0A915PG66_9BILA